MPHTHTEKLQPTILQKSKQGHTRFYPSTNCVNLNPNPNPNYLDYRYLQNSNESWYCRECCSTIFPFNSLCSNKNFLACCANTDNNTTQWIDLENDHYSSLSLKPSSHLELVVN